MCRSRGYQDPAIRRRPVQIRMHSRGTYRSTSVQFRRRRLRPCCCEWPLRAFHFVRGRSQGRCRDVHRRWHAATPFARQQSLRCESALRHAARSCRRTETQSPAKACPALGAATATSASSSSSSSSTITIFTIIVVIIAIIATNHHAHGGAEPRSQAMGVLT